jgi:hypothetical protein
MLKVWCVENSYLLAQTLTTEWHCETLGKLKAQLQRLFPHMEQPLLQHECLTKHKCKNYRDSAPWFHHVGSPYSPELGCPIFISFRS